MRILHSILAGSILMFCQNAVHAGMISTTLSSSENEAPTGFFLDPFEFEFTGLPQVSPDVSVIDFSLSMTFTDLTLGQGTQALEAIFVTGSLSEVSVGEFNSSNLVMASPADTGNPSIDLANWSGSYSPLFVNFTAPISKDEFDDGIVMFKLIPNDQMFFANPVGSVSLTLSYESQMSSGPVVPEPGSLALMGLGSLGLGVIARRRKESFAEAIA